MQCVYKLLRCVPALCCLVCLQVAAWLDGALPIGVPRLCHSGSLHADAWVDGSLLLGLPTGCHSARRCSGVHRAAGRGGRAGHKSSGVGAAVIL